MYYQENIKYKQMEMKINLDQILGSSKDDSLQSSMYSSSRTSELGSYQSQRSVHKFSYPIFVDEEPQQKPKSVYVPPKSKTPSVVSKQSESFEKSPGERLYYQSRATLARKNEQIQRKKLDSIKQEQKNMTFRPQINKNSKKIIQTMAKSPKIDRKQFSKQIPTQVKKFQEEIMQCTFKPELVSKSPYGETRYKAKGQVFQQLFNNHKFKKIKEKINDQLYHQEEKKVNTAQFESFLNRNNQFRSKIEKKKELITITSTIYDLKTGNKLFSPQTNINSLKTQSSNDFFVLKASSPKNKMSSTSPSSQFKSQPKHSTNASKKQNQKQAKTQQPFEKDQTITQNDKTESEKSFGQAKKNLKVIQEDKLDQQGEEGENFQTVKGLTFKSDNKLNSEPHEQNQMNQKQHPQELEKQNQTETEQIMAGVLLNTVLEGEVKKEETTENQVEQPQGKKKKKNFKSLMKKFADTHPKSQEPEEHLDNNIGQVETNTPRHSQISESKIQIIEDRGQVVQEKVQISESRAEDNLLKDSKSTVVQNHQDHSLKQSKNTEIQKIQENEQKQQDEGQKKEESESRNEDLSKIDEQSEFKDSTDQ